MREEEEGNQEVADDVGPGTREQGEGEKGR